MQLSGENQAFFRNYFREVAFFYYRRSLIILVETRRFIPPPQGVLSQNSYDFCDKTERPESPLADLFPNLFYRVHLRGIRWDERKVDILRDLQSVRPVPPGPVTDQQQLIVRKCLCHLFQKHVHTDCVAVREHKKESVSRLRFHRPICVPVFPYMVTGYGWPHPSLAPAALRFVDPPEPCFILEQYSHSLLGKFFLQFVVSGFNFFEAFTASLSAAFGCLDLGIIFRHPCRLSNR